MGINSKENATLANLVYKKILLATSYYLVRMRGLLDHYA